VSSTITIEGNSSTIARSSSTIFRFFSVASTGNLTLDGLTLSDGRAYGANIPGIEHENSGGAIYNIGTVTINDSTIQGSSAAGDADGGGGAIWNYQGTVTLNNSTISGNSAPKGGGLYNFGGWLTIDKSSVSGNSADTGAGIHNNSGPFVLTGSTVSHNEGNSSAGLSINFSDAVLSNCTVSNNSAATQSGFSIVGGSVDMINCTVANNSINGVAPSGLHINFSSTLTVSNSVISNPNSGSNIAGADCSVGESAVLSDAGNNWFGDDTCNGVAQGDPLLGLLANNGGTTLTHAPLASSALIDAGDDAVCAAIPINNLDQNGKQRPFGSLAMLGPLNTWMKVGLLLFLC
jgi:hypothetical protein